ncbi:electron transport protein SCO1/SenC [Thermocrinis albus DSM 14484]|uniref:Electron transport protein SCO1/SenC n=1 Tax=Thermocrinis albus (strain DSM 14484 / JCM 11386 / HI 11/12) TaxID=638303 RepID=D3SLC5_THEAH|nr:SCO family protein [Thermocrinis albus]ADC89555.1 electron transport protein SCO1/SenC [Thermocrinis albus DSM 14484]
MRSLLAVWIVLALLVSSCKKEHKFYGYLYDKPAYDFELTSQDGNRVRLSQFLKDGGVVLLFFGYTHCPDVCPTALSTMAKVMKNLSEKEREKVKVLFVSVDPERDTPAVLKNYVPFFYPTFVGLTGTPDEIAKVAKEYNVYYRKVKEETAAGYLVDHTATIYLITPDMKIKLLYTTNRQDPQKIAEDIRYLLSS